MEPRARPDVLFFAEIAAIERLSTLRLERALPGELTAASLAVLNQLVLAAEPLAPQGLAQALQLSRPAMTHTLQRLEGQGLVAITPDARDGRRKQVAITTAGAAAQRDAAAVARPILAAVRAAFNPSEFEAVLPFLQRLSAWLAANP